MRHRVETTASQIRSRYRGEYPTTGWMFLSETLDLPREMRPHVDTAVAPTPQFTALDRERNAFERMNGAVVNMEVLNLEHARPMIPARDKLR